MRKVFDPLQSRINSGCFSEAQSFYTFYSQSIKFSFSRYMRFYFASGAITKILIFFILSELVLLELSVSLKSSRIIEVYFCFWVIPSQINKFLEAPLLNGINISNTLRYRFFKNGLLTHFQAIFARLNLTQCFEPKCLKKISKRKIKITKFSLTFS